MMHNAIENAEARARATTAHHIAELREAFTKIPDECRGDLQRAAVYAVVDAYDNDRMNEGDGIAAMLPDAVRTLLDWYWKGNESDEIPKAQPSPSARPKMLTGEQIRLILIEVQYTSQYKPAKKYGCSRSQS